MLSETFETEECRSIIVLKAILNWLLNQEDQNLDIIENNYLVRSSVEEIDISHGEIQNIIDDFKAYDRIPDPDSDPVIFSTTETLRCVCRGLSALWLSVGIWPCASALGVSSANSGKSKGILLSASEPNNQPVLSILGLGFVYPFSTQLTKILERITLLHRHPENNDSPPIEFPSDLFESFDLFHFFYRDCLTQDQLIHDIEEVGYTYFRDHWESRFSNQNWIQKAKCCWCLWNSYLKSVLSEYNAFGGGWRVGKSGLHENMEVRLKALVDSLRASLLSLRLPSTLLSDENRPKDVLKKHFTVYSLAGTSVSCEVSRSAIEILTVALLNRDLYLRSGDIGGYEANVIKSVWKAVAQISSILSLLACEQLVNLSRLCAVTFIESMNDGVIKSRDLSIN